MMEVQFEYRFESAHRFTSSASDHCRTPHGHTWWASLIFEKPASGLNADGMIQEFSQLKSQWKAFITETVDHSFLHHYQDPLLPALREHIPGFRGLAFPCDPTTEVIAGLFLEKAHAMSGDLKPVGIRIKETPTNSITYRKESSRPFLEEAFSEKMWNGWWMSADPTSRSCEEIS